jgi:hypothetical protein
MHVECSRICLQDTKWTQHKGGTGGEEESRSKAFLGDLVAVRLRNSPDEATRAEAAQLVRHLTSGVIGGGLARVSRN